MYGNKTVIFLKNDVRLKMDSKIALLCRVLIDGNAN